MHFSNAVKHLNFIKKKPLVLLKIINGYSKGLLLRKPVLRTVDFAVTNLCNSRCKFCSAHLLYKTETRKPLGPDEIISAFRQASKLGAMHINLTGGEPLLRDIDELCYIIKNIKPQFHLISLVTNSLSVTEEKLKKLKVAGLDTIQLSIESMDAAVHDEVRGVPGNWDKVMQAFKYALGLDLVICLSTVITHLNFSEVKKIIKFAEQQKKGGIFVLLNPISASGALIGQSEYKLDQQDLKEYQDLLRIDLVRADTIVNFNGRSGCPGGTERIHITAFGDVITCPHVQISYGNIKEEPLEKIWTRMYNFPDLKKYSNVCKHAFDQEYYDKFLRPIENIKEVPVSVFEHPTLKAEIKK